jgi:hypothetical protein
LGALHPAISMPMAIKPRRTANLPGKRKSRCFLIFVLDVK